MPVSATKKEAIELNVAAEPVVRTGLTAGGRWIRTSSSARDRLFVSTLGTE
jgi:hypothetical protein